MLFFERLEKAGFKVSTDVQAPAIPTILEDHDVVIQSYTGSGKTLAYLLPILSGVGPFNKHSTSGNETKDKTATEAVIVAPFRELGMQIVREVEKLLGPADKKLVQQLVVGTSGQTAEISAAGKLHTRSCQYLVLDEVDELLAFNFREDMHRILA